jgi:transposase
MDVHKENYTLCCYSIEKDEVFAAIQMEPDFMKILKYLEQVKKNIGDCEFICGYEAGSLGYTLYHQLTNSGVKCVILAPSTMPKKRKGRIKTDKRDAEDIAKCLAFRTYSPVYIPSDEDNAVKEYIRMRDDEKGTLKRIKQRILAFCTRHGKHYSDGSNWTLKHLAWLKKQDFGNAILTEAFQEYIASYCQSADKIKTFDKRIEEFAKMENYEEKVKMLSCFKGIKTHTAMALIVETGDFKRFEKAKNYSAYLGLVPGEDSSGDTKHRTGITKAGNSHLRRLLIESAQCYQRGVPGVKSKTISRRQQGNDPKVIAYADKANERLRRKFYRIKPKSKYGHSIAAAAVARELACFVWGMMTGNMELSCLTEGDGGTEAERGLLLAEAARLQ